MKISVIIPAYNCENFIAQTLCGIYAQTMSRDDMEIIVCLDAPTDNTAAVVRSWARAHRDVNIKIIENKTNRGVSYSRNIAARAARGEYIHFMDSDDFINVGFYDALYQSASTAGADIAVASFEYEQQPHNSINFDVETIVQNPQDRIDVTRVDAHGMMWRYLIRRRFWRDNKFAFPEDVRFCEDWLLANQMVQAANYLVTVPLALYVYKYRDNSLMQSLSHNTAYQGAGERAGRDVAAFLDSQGLRPHLRSVMVLDWRLFGGIRLVTVSRSAGDVIVRLFGKWTLFKITRNYRYHRGHK